MQDGTPSLCDPWLRIPAARGSLDSVELIPGLPRWQYVVPLSPHGCHRNDVKPHGHDLDVLWVTAPLVPASNVIFDLQLQQRSCDEASVGILKVLQVIGCLSSRPMLMGIDSKLPVPSVPSGALRKVSQNSEPLTELSSTPCI